MVRPARAKLIWPRSSITIRPAKLLSSINTKTSWIATVRASERNMNTFGAHLDELRM
jgi:hypothetical protein